ncbi:DUF6671 family protein [Psychroflexus tropicus]|uniref:DUF6671 family protein n=1 Tax=Psychroflexus tropicus TaxID=197345 RepID=UPI00037C8088|nr:DUF6671 family protein [Psychroflexus tropicus]
MFQNRRLIIATKHKKEKVIAPLLESAFGVKCFTDQSFDTDSFGSFSGEIERTHGPLETARQKCLAAMKKNNCDLGIASEGSFGPHPSVFLINADDEFMIFIDKKNNIEVIARELSPSTNFNGKTVSSKKDLIEFADKVDFPTHGLILRPSKDDNSEVYKGIIDEEFLKNQFESLKSKYGKAYVETDMRAMYNPTRMQVIEQLTKKLVDQINSKCPECEMPGFTVSEVIKGLKCSLCGQPTNSTLSFIYLCKHCEFKKEQLYPHQKTTEDPMYCDFCNP